MDAWLWRWGELPLCHEPRFDHFDDLEVGTARTGTHLRRAPFSTRQYPRTFSPCRTSPGWPSGLRTIETGAGVWKAKPSKIDVYACVLSRERLCDLLRSIWQPICRSIGHFWSNFWRWWFLLPSKVLASFLDQERWSAFVPFGASSTTSTPFEWIHQCLWQLPTDFYPLQVEPQPWTVSNKWTPSP